MSYAFFTPNFCYRLDYFKIVWYYFFEMKIFSTLLKIANKAGQKTLAEYKQEMLVKQGREQFRRLQEKGLSVPVALL